MSKFKVGDNVIAHWSTYHPETSSRSYYRVGKIIILKMDKPGFAPGEKPYGVEYSDGYLDWFNEASLTKIPSRAKKALSEKRKVKS